MDLDRKSPSTLASVLVLSVSIHGGAWWALGLLPPLSSLIQRIESVEVDVFEQVPPPPEPEPTVAPEPPTPEPESPPSAPEPPRPRERPVVRREAPPPPSPAEPPPAREEQIADFTGETLTVAAPGAWTSAVGNGQDMQGPIGAPTGLVTGRRRVGSQEGVVGGTGQGAVEEIVAIRDLRELPRPPDESRIVEALRRRYPPRLRSLSVEGRAVVRVRIRANGDLGRITVSSSSEPEFGQACIDALRDAGNWRPAIGPAGEPSATEVRFTCDFALAF